MLKHLLLQFVTLYSLQAAYVQMSASAYKWQDSSVLVIGLDHKKNWHTYWKNPGEAGIPSAFEFSLAGQKIELEDFEWQAPRRFIESGGIFAYGYSDKAYFFFTIPSDLTQQGAAPLQVTAKWLACENICVPEEASTSISLPPKQNLSSVPQIYQAFQELPEVSQSKMQLELTVSKGLKENTLALHYSLPKSALKKYDASSNLLTPFPLSPFDFGKENLVFDEQTQSYYARLPIKWDGEYEEPPVSLPADGSFPKEYEFRFLLQTDEGSKKISLATSQFATEGDAAYQAFLQKRSLPSPSNESFGGNESLIYYILLAFLGGLILNLMPCVLPVISLKLFGLINYSKKPKAVILKHNTFYSLGVLLTFMALATAIAMLKLSGEKIGWGFQLQSPSFVFFLMTIVFIMVLNLFGLFEFITPGGKILGNKQLNDSYSGDFFNGILATILATPCSAPFLGVALTFAFTTNLWNIYIIFTFVALGLAFPFLLTALFPSLVSLLPRPGSWMIKLKYFLGLSLLLTFVWLNDILFALIDSYYMFSIDLFFVGLFFAYFARKFITKRFLYSSILFLAPVIIFINIQNQGGFELAPKESSYAKGSLEWTPWTSAKVQAMQAKKQWVFLNFTASWCLTCKVNKKLVLDTQAFEALVNKYDIQLLVGDWTKRDDQISEFLRSNGLVGVPAYFLINPDGEQQYLGETLSISEIEKELNQYSQ